MTKPDHAGYAAPLRPEKPETEVKRPDANGGPQPDPPGTEEWLSRFLPEPAPKSSGQTVLSDGIKIISLVDEGPTSSASGPPMYIEETPSRLPSRRHAKAEEEIVFNLHTLVREVHNLVAPLARTRDLLFSWFIAPSLPVLVAGDGAGLRDTLIRLLQCALQVTKQGIVQLSVRKSPGENGPGDLLFSIRDSGSVQRSHAGLFRAWQLAADNEGVFNLEYSPSAGTQVSFTVHFALPTDAMVEEYYQRQQESDYFALSYGFESSTDEEDDLIPVLQTVAAPGEPESLVEPERAEAVREAFEEPSPLSALAVEEIPGNKPSGFADVEQADESIPESMPDAGPDSAPGDVESLYAEIYETFPRPPAEGETEKGGGGFEPASAQPGAAEDALTETIPEGTQQTSDVPIEVHEETNAGIGDVETLLPHESRDESIHSGVCGNSASDDGPEEFIFSAELRSHEELLRAEAMVQESAFDEPTAESGADGYGIHGLPEQHQPSNGDSFAGDDPVWEARRMGVAHTSSETFSLQGVEEFSQESSSGYELRVDNSLEDGDEPVLFAFGISQDEEGRYSGEATLSGASDHPENASFVEPVTSGTQENFQDASFVSLLKEGDEPDAGLPVPEAFVSDGIESFDQSRIEHEDQMGLPDNGGSRDESEAQQPDDEAETNGDLAVSESAHLTHGQTGDSGDAGALPDAWNEAEDLPLDSNEAQISEADQTTSISEMERRQGEGEEAAVMVEAFPAGSPEPMPSAEAPGCEAEPAASAVAYGGDAGGDQVDEPGLHFAPDGDASDGDASYGAEVASGALEREPEAAGDAAEGLEGESGTAVEQEPEKSEIVAQSEIPPSGGEAQVGPDAPGNAEADRPSADDVASPAVPDVPAVQAGSTDASVEAAGKQKPASPMPEKLKLVIRTRPSATAAARKAAAEKQEEPASSADMPAEPATGGDPAEEAAPNPPSVEPEDHAGFPVPELEHDEAAGEQAEGRGEAAAPEAGDHDDTVISQSEETETTEEPASPPVDGDLQKIHEPEEVESVAWPEPIVVTSFETPAPERVEKPFSFIPAAAFPAEPSARVQPASPEPSGLEPRIIIAETTTSNRRLLAHYLADFPHEHIDSSSNDEVLEILRNKVVSLLVFDADMQDLDLAATIKTIRRKEQEWDIGPTPILSLVSRSSQASRMALAGSSYSLSKPFSRALFLESVLIAAPQIVSLDKLSDMSRFLDDESDPETDLEDVPSTSGPRASGLQAGGEPQAEKKDRPARPEVSFVRDEAVRPREASQRAEARPAGVPPWPGESLEYSSAEAPIPTKQSKTPGNWQYISGYPVQEQPGVVQGGGRVSEMHPGRSVGLPGIRDESLDQAVLPLIPGLIQFLQGAHREILRGFGKNRNIMVEEAAGRIASRAEAFGLHKIGRIARCLERAGQAEDRDAITALLEDLEPVMKLYVDSLNQLAAANVRRKHVSE